MLPSHQQTDIYTDGQETCRFITKITKTDHRMYPEPSQLHIPMIHFFKDPFQYYSTINA